MDKKTMYVTVAVVVVIIAAAVGAVLLLNKGTASGPNAKVVLLQKTPGAHAYSPLDQEAVYNGSYPLSRYLYLYTDGVPNSTSSLYEWLSYIYSANTGEQDVANAGFYPLQSTDHMAMMTQLSHGNTRGPSGDFTEGGSTTMTEVANLWAAGFKTQTGHTVTLSAGGSGVGIGHFIAGELDVAQASRAMTAQEKATAISNGINVTEWKVAVDGLSIIVNKDNPVSTLTLVQLEGLFNGTYTNWNQVGGSNTPVTLYGRDEASGSYASFKDMVLVHKENYAASMLQANSNALILPEVENDVGGVGYVGIGYAKEASGQSGTAAQMSMALILAAAEVEL
ncbi:MAG: substrate-binding domain-containing protein [Methanomassiliicoccales archaeon]|nr:substrate-binding domain-containing protein [Methanomassiliicoccales archaeon]